MLIKNRFYLKRNLNNFDFFFCHISDCLYLKNKYLWKCYNLPLFVFLNINYSLKLLNFLFLNNLNIFWNIFWNIVSLNRKFSLGYFVEIKIIGLGYRIKKLNNFLYRFFWGYATYIYLFIPDNLKVQYSYSLKTLIIFGIDQNLINNFVSFLILLKKLSKYRLLGITKPNKIIRLKVGKKR